MNSPSGITGCSGSARLRPVVIGLTGPIASGKSTVAAMLRERGADVIDADRIYGLLLAAGSPLWTAVVRRFGQGIVRDDGEIDRASLGAIVFQNADALADLECLTHPAVVAEIRHRIAGSNARVVVIEAVKLVQSGLLADVDYLWLVTADPGVRQKRLMLRGGVTAEQAQDRIAASLHVVPQGVPIDATIDNSGGRAATARAVDAAWQSSCRGEPRMRRLEASGIGTSEGVI